jgi:hypothetical protein
LKFVLTAKPAKKMRKVRKKFVILKFKNRNSKIVIHLR